MMLYLTGAQTPLTKSGGVSPQSDVNNSLGGYISSSPVPNGALNNIFDLISSYTLEKRTPETLAFALINKFDFDVKDVSLKVVTDEGNLASFKVSAVAVDKDNMTMEHIANRYQQPIGAEFYDASFYRAAVNVKMDVPAVKGEEIVFYPMNVVVDVKEGGVEGTWQAISDAFEEDDTYTVKRISVSTFRIERRDEEVLETPLDCSFLSSESSSFTFEGKLLNKADNSVILSDEFKAGDCIGIWIQRNIKKTDCESNEEILQNYKDKFNYPTIEEIDLIISYNLVEKTQDNYDEEYEKPSYS